VGGAVAQVRHGWLVAATPLTAAGQDHALQPGVKSAPMTFRVPLVGHDTDTA
jgi:hypothetical protein